jgi:protein O-GlcNAc transferase
MAWMEENDGNGKEKELGGENGFLKVKEPSVSAGGDDTVSGNKRSEVKDDISFANILRSRNKFTDSLALYERVLESDGGNVEALIGKGICLQMQNMGRLAFDSFSEAVKLDSQNACALTHCGILYKEEGRLMEAAEVCTC